MHVTITLNFEDEKGYEEWLARQALVPRGTSPEREPVPDMPGGAAQTEPAPDKKDKKPRKPRKPRAPKKETPAQAPATTEEEVLPVAPVATETAPIDGEKMYTLADSREVLTAYLAKPGNGAESLLKELKVHNAKRINEVPPIHIHGFLKRMVEAS